MKILESTRTINDACEVKRQLLQQEAPLRFRMAVPPTALADGTPLDSSTRVYAERPIINPYFHGQLTRDRARINVQKEGFGIPTLPGTTTGPLLAPDTFESLTQMRSHPGEIVNTCGRFTMEPRWEAVEPRKALLDIPNLPEYPSSTRAEHRQHWSGCQNNFVRELKQQAPAMTAAMDQAPSKIVPPPVAPEKKKVRWND
jgi:hypothetical protein